MTFSILFLRRRARAGFTLIELLTVIAIIGILATIIIPVTAKARKAAQSARCLGNLRQLGTAVMLATQNEKGEMFPFGYLASNGQFWNQLIGDYLGETGPGVKRISSAVAFCPAEKVKATVDSTRTNYIANPSLMPERKVKPEGEPPSQQVRLSSVSLPSQTVLIIDGTVGTTGQADWGFYNQTQWKTNLYGRPPDEAVKDETADGGARISWRHGGNTQAVMVDGSARVFRPGSLLTRNLRRTN